MFYALFSWPDLNLSMSQPFVLALSNGLYWQAYHWMGLSLSPANSQRGPCPSSFHLNSSWFIANDIPVEGQICSEIIHLMESFFTSALCNIVSSVATPGVVQSVLTVCGLALSERVRQSWIDTNSSKRERETKTDSSLKDCDQTCRMSSSGLLLSCDLPFSVALSEFSPHSFSNLQFIRGALVF